MDELERKAIGGLLKLLVGMAGMMFVAAGTLRYWQAWLYLAVFGGTSFAIGQFLLAHDRTLLERRLRSGPAAEWSDGYRWLMARSKETLPGSLPTRN
jgi:hypothetical protein